MTAFDEAFFRRICHENPMLALERIRGVYMHATGRTCPAWRTVQRIALDVPEWADAAAARRRRRVWHGERAPEVDLVELADRYRDRRVDAIRAAIVKAASLAETRDPPRRQSTPRSPVPEIDHWIREARAVWRRLCQHRGQLQSEVAP